MKVLYLTVPSYFDLEISLIRELSKVCEVKVIMIVSPQSMHSSAFSIERLLPECKIVKSKDFPGIEKYDSLIDKRKWLIANNPDNSIQSCFRLARMIKRTILDFECDIVHSTTTCKTALFLLPFIRSLRCTLYTLHDPIPHNKMPWYLRLARYDLTFFSYKNLLLLSASLEQEFIKNNRKLYRNIYHSSLSIYDFLTSYVPAENKYGRYILFFGRIDQYKGVDLLKEAFSQSNARKKGINLVVAGKGKKMFNTEIRDDEGIILLNRYISNEELATLIYHSIFVVLPYRSATQSGCVFSAFAFGKPILATNVGDLPLQIGESCGMIVEPNSVDAIVRGINEMLEADLAIMNKSILQRYSEGGARSWASIASGLFEVYASVLNSSN